MPRWFLLVSLCFLYLCSYSQPDSTITQTQSLLYLGKVWGFLKYYHPQVATGKSDWDTELVRFIDTLPSVQTKEELSARLVAWIRQLGPVAPCRHCPLPDSTAFTRNINLNWLSDSSAFSLPLRQELAYIAANRNQRSNQYVHWNPFRNRLEFSESAYAHMALPGPSYRLLGLFRYWAIIEYFHPAKYTLQPAWDRALAEFIPKFQRATDTLAYQRVLQQLITRIQDGHAELFVPISHRLSLQPLLHPPINYRLVGDTLVVIESLNDSLSQRDDVRKGDRIIRVEGQSVAQYIDQRITDLSASNRSAKIRQILPVLLAGSQPVIKLELIRHGNHFEREIHRFDFQQFGYRPSLSSSGPSDKVPPTIGYVDMGALTMRDVKRVMTRFWNRKGIIFDLRGYPKGTYQKLSTYLNSQPMGFARYTKPDLSSPGLFKRSAVHQVGRTNVNYYRGKVAILCNSNTQSAAETSCLALRTAPQAKIIGSQSAGAEGDVCYTEFPGGYRTRFSGTGVYTPDMRFVQGQGVPIDIEAKPSYEDVLTGTDRPLQTAIDWINQ